MFGDGEPSHEEPFVFDISSDPISSSHVRAISVADSFCIAYDSDIDPVECYPSCSSCSGFDGAYSRTRFGHHLGVLHGIVLNMDLMEK